MATYKVLQDIEAEDKLVGPLTLWQFIYALGAGLCIYLSAIAVMKGVPAFLILLVPIALFATFLAVPWGGDQPTEVWALAKLRFFLKPRKRIWNQDGMTELVTITAPKTIERVFTDGLSQREVASRLSVLANTLDSRGWAVKNVNVNMSATSTPTYVASDRLVDVSANPIQEVVAVDVRPDDDMLDETANPVAQNFNAMIDKAATEYRQALIDRMNKPDAPLSPSSSFQQTNFASNSAATTQQTAFMSDPTVTNSPIPTQPVITPTQNPGSNWFMPHTATPVATPIDDSTPVSSGVPQAAEPTDEERALLEQSKQISSMQTASYGRLKTVKTPQQIAEEEQQAAAIAAAEAAAAAVAAAEEQRRKAAIESEKQAAIINLSQRDDLDIATLARQIPKTDIVDDGEVVISLH